MAAVFLAASFVASAVHGEVVATPHVKAELLLEKPSVAPGESFDVALRLQMKEAWHTYWKHPGDSGEPTDITWTLPAGFTAGDSGRIRRKSASIRSPRTATRAR
jgi:thiol:disulfide interchange protein DsbD